MDGKRILSLNAFEPGAASGLGQPLAARIERRARVFGAASMLFYDEPLQIVRGAGCWLYDAAGTAYLDAYNNVPSVGHCHPRVVEAVTRQLQQLNVHTRYLHDGIDEYAARLLATLPAPVSTLTFTCTGSESNDLALRLAAAYTGARGVIVTEAAYHGNTGLATEVSPASFMPAAPPPHVRLVPAPAANGATPAEVSRVFAEHVAAAIEDLERCGLGVAALLVDGIFSSDGVYPHPRGFLRAAVDAVHRAQGLFIADEVQCGFGRTGESLWGFERHGLRPDVVTFGKPMGNGYPMGAVASRPDILQALCSRTGYFNTFGGSPVAAAAGQAVLDVIQAEDLMGNSRRVGTHLEQGLIALAARHPQIAEVRAVGLYLGVALRDVREAAPVPPATRGAELARIVVNALRRRRVLIGVAGRQGDVLKIRPPLCFSSGDADHLLAALDEGLSAVGRAAA